MAERFAPDLEQFVRDIHFAVEDPDNANEHPEENIEAVKESLEKYGQVKPVVFWRDDQGRPVIKAGNGTARAAKELGWTKLAMTEFLGTEEEALGYALADNHAAKLSVWNVPKRDAQLQRLGIKWDPPKVDWKPAPASFSPPVTIVPPKTAPVRRETLPGSAWERGETEAPTPVQDCRVAYGDLWLLGDHKVMCVSPTDDKSIRLLCSGERPSLRYVTVPPDTKPAWWGPGAEHLPPFLGFEVLIHALQGELAKGSLSSEEVDEITRSRESDKWFYARLDWELVTKDVYEALRDATNGEAFNHPYAALLEVVARLQSGADRETDAKKIALEAGDKAPVLVLGSVLPGTLVAAEQVGRRCFGALADPKACDEAITFWESQTGLTAEKA